MLVSILTYNTLYNNGFENFEKVLEKITFKPDILCFQEVDTSEINLKKIEKFGYILADYENSFTRFGKIYGAATFYNPKVLDYINSNKKIINKIFFGEYFTSFVSFLFGFGRQKTFLLTDFYHKKKGKKISVCNTHLFVLGSNNMRMKNIEEVIKKLKIKNKKYFIICGDFNYYPYQRKKLEKFMKKYFLKEATTNINQTIKFSYEGFLSETLTIIHKFSLRIIKQFTEGLKIDYIFYKGLKLINTKKIDIKYSDHFPMISKFSL